MAVKGGQILHVAGGPSAGFVVDRIQTAGVTGININEDRVEELGNYQAVGTTRDIPDLTFEIQSFDATTELESLLTGGGNAETAGHKFNLAEFVPLDILSPFKGQAGSYEIVGGVIIPFLSLESMSYNMSLTDSATMTATLRGDSVFYSKGSVWQETFDGDGGTTTFNFANGPAYKSVIGGDDYYGLSVMMKDSEGIWKRQRLGTDYTNNATGITFATAPATGTGNIKVVYTSGASQEFLQAVHDTTKPAGVRGRDIQVRLGSADATPVFTDWLGVQSANVDWRVTVERDEEFGNNQIVAQDFETPEVSGTVTMKPRDTAALFEQVQAIAGISGTDVANATQDPPELHLEFRIKDPETGNVLKTLAIPDAKFSMPSIQGQVGQKLEQDFAFVSATGVLDIYKGAPA